LARKPDGYKERAGWIGVDAGIIWVGDPCYLKGALGGKDDQVTWQRFCDRAWAEAEARGDKWGPAEPLGQDLGFWIPSGYGDGRYPVTVEYHDGRPMRVTIEFFATEDQFQDEDDDAV
jgi:hypothetical protein